MFQTLKNAFKQKDIRKKLLIILGIILVYRLGCWLPIPGLNPDAFGSITGENPGFLNLLSSVSGGALANGSLLALGVVPYISASIIMQLLTVAIPALERISKSGEDGRKKIALYTRIAALVFSVMQAIAIVVAFNSNGAINLEAFGAGSPTWLVPLVITLVLIAGGMFTLWLGEKITDQGIGNGVSLLIFVGILSSAGFAFLSACKQVGTNIEALWDILIFIAVLIVVFGLMVFVDLAERKIPVQYAKQVKGRKMYGGQSTMIPIKVNANGVLPIIFATALVTFPQLITQMFWPNSGFYNWWATYLGTGTPLYFVFNAVFIFFFSYFYAQISFNPEDVSRNLQQSGGFITGIRAGRPTTDYLKKINNRITLFGATYLSIIFIVPTLILSLIPMGGANLMTAFSVTGMLIVVSVALEFDKQLDAQMLMKNYRGFLK